MHRIAIVALMVSVVAGDAERRVITVAIHPALTLLQWPGMNEMMLENVKSWKNLSTNNKTRQQEDGRINYSIRESEVVDFYGKVYSQSDALVIYVDLRHSSCPMDIFQHRLLSYITMSTTQCPGSSESTAYATLMVQTWSFDVMKFMSEFLGSWSRNTAYGQVHTSFALLFGESGEDHFLHQNRKVIGTLMFEMTLPLVNCSDSGHVTNVAAKTNIKDVIVVATSSCMQALFLAVSRLHLPYSRFRWLLYPTDGNETFNLDNSTFVDAIQPVLITERNKPRKRPVHRLSKLLSFAHDAVQSFEYSLQKRGANDLCQLNCSTNCYGCQELFKETLKQIPGQRHEVFSTKSGGGNRGILYELHRMTSAGNTYLGNWSQQTGLGLNQIAYPVSFNDSQLSVVLVVEPPFVYRNISLNGEISYYGYSVDVLMEIASRVGFSYTMRECDYGGYGLLEKGRWTGCIGNVVRGEADVILGALTVTAERDKVVDFTLPYYNFAGIQILMRKQAANIDLFYYANVFTTPAWLSLGAVVVITSLLLWVFEQVVVRGTQKGNRSVCKYSDSASSLHLPHVIENNGDFMALDGSQLGNGARSQGTDEHLNYTCNSTNSCYMTDKTLNGKKPKTRSATTNTIYTLGESTWFVVGALTMAGGGDPPRSLSGRLLVVGFWFFAVTMMSTFTANLAAFLTVSRMGMTVSSLDDLAAQTDVKYSVVDQSSVMEYFQRMAKIEEDFYERWKTISLDKTPEDSTQRSLAVWDYPLGNKYGAMWATIKATGLVKSNEIGLEKVKMENFALITESPLIQYYVDRNCDLTGVGDQFSIRPYAIGLKEGSPYTNLFSDAILELQKERKLGSLRLRWWTNNEGTCPKDPGNAGLDLYSLSGTFIVAGVGVASGLIALVLESIIANFKSKKCKECFCLSHTHTS